MESKVSHFFNRLDTGVDEVRKLSQEFREKLGLTQFAYIRIYHDGRTSSFDTKVQA